MTAKEFAKRAEISLSLPYLLIAEGRVPHRRIGQGGKRGVIRISEEDYEEFMVNCKDLACPPLMHGPARRGAPRPSGERLRQGHGPFRYTVFSGLGMGQWPRVAVMNAIGRRGSSHG